MNLPWELPTRLAIKAKELTQGMRYRAKRDPDVADFRAAFLTILQDAFTGHRLVGLSCDEDNQTDTAVCECGFVSGPLPRVGAAFDAWMDHVNNKRTR